VVDDSIRDVWPSRNVPQRRLGVSWCASCPPNAGAPLAAAGAGSRCRGPRMTVVGSRTHPHMCGCC